MTWTAFAILAMFVISSNFCDIILIEKEVFDQQLFDRGLSLIVDGLVSVTIFFLLNVGCVTLLVGMSQLYQLITVSR